MLSTDAGTPARRAGHRLSRERVLTAALELVDRSGLEALTLRQLAAELGVEPAAIYRYAPSKQALLDGLVEQVMSRLAVDPEDPDWRAQLHRDADSYRDLILAHPDVLPLIATRPLMTPLVRRPRAVLRHAEGILELLCRAGLDGAAAGRLYRRFFSYQLGQLLLELREAVDDPGEEEPVLRMGLHRLPRAEFPRLRAIAPTVLGYDARQELHEGLDVLFDSLDPARVPAGGAPRPSHPESPPGDERGRHATGRGAPVPSEDGGD
jgi:AcrR family transcriptional regulator